MNSTMRDRESENRGIGDYASGSNNSKPQVVNHYTIPYRSSHLDSSNNGINKTDFTSIKNKIQLLKGRISGSSSRLQMDGVG